MFGKKIIWYDDYEVSDDKKELLNTIESCIRDLININYDILKLRDSELLCNDWDNVSGNLTCLYNKKMRIIDYWLPLLVNEFFNTGLFKFKVKLSYGRVVVSEPFINKFEGTHKWWCMINLFERLNKEYSFVYVGCNNNFIINIDGMVL